MTIVQDEISCRAFYFHYYLSLINIPILFPFIVLGRLDKHFNHLLASILLFNQRIVHCGDFTFILDFRYFSLRQHLVQIVQFFLRQGFAHTFSIFLVVTCTKIVFLHALNCLHLLFVCTTLFSLHQIIELAFSYLEFTVLALYYASLLVHVFLALWTLALF